MARAYASTILNANIATVWATIRDFNGLPSWHPAIARSEIEDGLDSDVVGCVRRFFLQDGTMVRERLLSLCDRTTSFTYNFETPAFPVTNYRARVRLMPVTATGQTFAEWEATFDEAPEDAGKYVDIISNGVFQGGWDALKKALPTRPKVDAPLWHGFPPNKVWCSTVIPAPASAVWNIIRDFASMGEWHPDITKMHMLGGARPDKVSGTRDFLFGPGHLNEVLLHLDDEEMSYSYYITKCELPWVRYVSGPRLWRVTDGDHCFATWWGDWAATAQDDLSLIPTAENAVYLKAYETVAARLAGGR
jgi:hypothetical protein